MRTLQVRPGVDQVGQFRSFRIVTHQQSGLPFVFSPQPAGYLLVPNSPAASKCTQNRNCQCAVNDDHASRQLKSVQHEIVQHDQCQHGNDRCSSQTDKVRKRHITPPAMEIPEQVENAKFDSGDQRHPQPEIVGRFVREDRFETNDQSQPVDKTKDHQMAGRQYRNMKRSNEDNEDLNPSWLRLT